ncbi:hypothetical protein NMG60_11018999 [Bertholletia excelsa]
MLVANSFDLWQKDAFFSAAEEVQQSADIMESTYRTWEREKREGLTSVDLNQRFRELQIALGTAKWQLEEFEKAVRLSYRNRADDITMARHRQFVDAIENQISRVETAMQESLYMQGKKPLRWVHLNEEERNDLAAFLSGIPGTKKAEYTKSGASTNSFLQENNYFKKEACHRTKASCKGDIFHDTKGSEDLTVHSEDAKYAIDIEAAPECSGTNDNIKSQGDRAISTRRTWSSPDFGALKIVINDKDDQDKDEQNKALVPNIEVTPKEKGSRPIFWRQRCGYHPELKGGILSYSKLQGIRWINQVGGYQRQLQTPLNLKLSSVRFTLALMLTIFLVVPFVLYAT